MSQPDNVIAVMVPLIADLAANGKAGVALAGSHGKGRADRYSDYDFRAYSDAYRPNLPQTPQWQRFLDGQRSLQEQGVLMDGIWLRSYTGVRRDLDGWLSGYPPEKNFEWTIWGYQLPTDLHSQLIINDPLGHLMTWRQELEDFPEPIRRAIFERYRTVLTYWKSDYHYASKVNRLDMVFLAGITSKLVNALMQIVFAYNRRYFPGDGWNMAMAAELPHLPRQFLSRMTEILEPTPGPDRRHQQRLAILSMITDVETMISASDGRETLADVEERRAGASKYRS